MRHEYKTSVTEEIISGERYLKDHTDLEKTIKAAGLDIALAAVIKAFVDQKGMFLVLSKNMAVERILKQGAPRSAATYKSDLFDRVVLRLNQTPNVLLRFSSRIAKWGKDGRPVQVYWLEYR